MRTAKQMYWILQQRLINTQLVREDQKEDSEKMFTADWCRRPTRSANSLKYKNQNTYPAQLPSSASAELLMSPAAKEI